MIKELIGGSTAGSLFLALGSSIGLANPFGISLALGGAVILLGTLAMVA